MPDQLVVGFDLDLTLVDSRPGIAAAYRALSARTGVPIDAEAAVGRLGPPLEVEIARWFPAEEVAATADLYRAMYPQFAVTDSPALAGAVESFAEVRARGGRVVVITGKHVGNARLHLDHLGLDADAVEGMAWAQGKVDAMRAHGVQIYVGDHSADMASAREAGALAVGVVTGAHTAEQLHEAGAHAVLPSLLDFPAYLELSLPI